MFFCVRIALCVVKCRYLSFWNCSWRPVTTHLRHKSDTASSLISLYNRHISKSRRVTRRQHLVLHLPHLLDPLPAKYSLPWHCQLILHSSDISALLLVLCVCSSNRFSCATPWLKKLHSITPVFWYRWSSRQAARHS